VQPLLGLRVQINQLALQFKECKMLHSMLTQWRLHRVSERFLTPTAHSRNVRRNLARKFFNKLSQTATKSKRKFLTTKSKRKRAFCKTIFEPNFVKLSNSKMQEKIV
jgi:hypothetical protein